VDDWTKKLADNKAHWGNVKLTEFGKGSYDIAPAGSADLVITSRNVHNWMGAGFADEAFGAFYKALKPGGILSVEEHRGPADQPQDPKARERLRARRSHDRAGEEGRLRARQPLRALANKKDTKDWPKGVWTLPPTLALGEQDRDKYLPSRSRQLPAEVPQAELAQGPAMDEDVKRWIYWAIPVIVVIGAGVAYYYNRKSTRAQARAGGAGPAGADVAPPVNPIDQDAQAAKPLPDLA
jgi:SAM-dependent methyltransferase